MKLYQVRTGEITIGKPLAWDVYDSKGLLLLQEGYIVETQTQLDTLLLRGLYHISDKSFHKAAKKEPEIQTHVSPFQLIDIIYSKLEILICENAPGSEKTFALKIVNLCHELQQVCKKDADAALSTIVMGASGRYSIKHSLDIAIICELTGAAMKMPVEERLSLIAAAFTQNIAMTTLSDSLQKQEAPLSDEQRGEIRAHPARGGKILSSFGVNDDMWINTVLNHHESPDGKGYPHGLAGEAVPIHARLIALADYYCAKITGRDYRPPLSSHKAMQYVFSPKDSRVDAGLSELFIKTLGIYLPGTFVYLKNNQIAVVTRRGTKIHSPQVCAVTGKDGLLLPGPIRRDTDNPEYKIARVIPPEEVVIKVNRYLLWGYGKI